MNKKGSSFFKVVFLIVLFLLTKEIALADSTSVNVTASSATMIYGSTVPTITAIYNPNIVPATTTATCSTVANNTSPVGSYTSTCSGAADPNYTFTYTDGSFSVTQATPTITWTNPADIISGTALSETQLNATASVPGTFAYTPANETTLSTGANQTLSVTFTPTDTIDYTTTTGTTTINVIAQQTSSSGSSTQLNTQATVDVPTNCSATDTDGVIHNYPQDGSSNSYLAICALEAAIKSGSIYNVQLSNKYPTMGLFIAAINGVAADPNSQYWAIYQNGNYASSGITSLPVAAKDTVMFQLHDFSDNNLGNQVTLNINSLISNVISSGGTSGGHTINYTGTTNVSLPPTKQTFDTTKALNFLTSQQKADGSFGPDLYTDWTGIALASGNYQDQMLKLDKYFVNSKLENPSLTDSERQAMVLMSLGLNPYNTNGQNYINNITASFDGKQFGDKNQDNDDIFALIVLQNAGYNKDDKMISSDINFVLGAQNADGSWDSSVDMTGAAMGALSPFNQNDQVKASLAKAESFLKQNQKDNGSWNDNASSTAWAIEGILAQGEKVEDWIKVPKNGDTSVNSPLDYLATTQDTDGGVKDSNIQNKIWETAYVVSALSGKTWNQVMQKFEKQTLSIPAETAKVAAKKQTIKKVVLFKKGTSEKIANPTKPEVSTNQSTANVLSATKTLPAIQATQKKNWFTRLFNKIFGSR